MLPILPATAKKAYAKPATMFDVCFFICCHKRVEFSLNFHVEHKKNTDTYNTYHHTGIIIQKGKKIIYCELMDEQNVKEITSAFAKYVYKQLLWYSNRAFDAYLMMF